MAIAIYIGTIYPSTEQPSAPRETHRLRPWVAQQLQQRPGDWEQECKTLRASLRDALAEINRRGLIITEKDGNIAGLVQSLKEARKCSNS